MFSNLVRVAFPERSYAAYIALLMVGIHSWLIERSLLQTISVAMLDKSAFVLIFSFTTAFNFVLKFDYFKSLKTWIIWLLLVYMCILCRDITLLMDLSVLRNLFLRLKVQLNVLSGLRFFIFLFFLLDDLFCSKTLVIKTFYKVGVKSIFDLIIRTTLHLLWDLAPARADGSVLLHDEEILLRSPSLLLYGWV